MGKSITEIIIKYLVLAILFFVVCVPVSMLLGTMTRMVFGDLQEYPKIKIALALVATIVSMYVLVWLLKFLYRCFRKR